MTGSVGHVYFKTFTLKKLYGHFYGWASIGKATQPLRGDSLVFTTRFPGLPGTQRMKD